MFLGHPEMVDQFRPWLNYVGNAKYTETVGEDYLVGERPFYVYKYGDFGPKNAIYLRNVKTVAGAANNSSNTNNRRDKPNVLDVLDVTTVPLPNNSSNANNRRDKQIVLDEKTFTLPNILKELTSGNEVIYIPSTSKPSYIVALNRLSDRLEFIFADTHKNMKDETIFMYEIDLTQPMRIRPTEHVLLMFMLLKDASEIKNMLRNSYQFLSRIRCHVLKAVRGLKMGGGGGSSNSNSNSSNSNSSSSNSSSSNSSNSNSSNSSNSNSSNSNSNVNSRDTEDATNFLYGAAGGRRRVQKTRRRKHARRSTRVSSTRRRKN
jgi:hypothetical protein